MTAIPALPVTMYDENETIVVSTPAGYWQAIWEGFRVSGPVPPPARSEVPAHLSDLDTVEAKIPSAASLSATFAGRVEPASYTYNPDGTVATETVGGLTTTYAYNADGTVHTATRNGVTLTYSYNTDGTVAGVA